MVCLKRVSVFWKILEIFKKLLFTLPVFYAIHKIELLIQRKESGKLCRMRFFERIFKFANHSSFAGLFSKTERALVG